MLKFRIVLVLFCLFAIVNSAMAQARKHDLIIKKDSTKTEANILVVADQTIDYKKVSDPNGPLFQILKSDVARIIYGNGETESFSNQKLTPSASHQSPFMYYPMNPWLQKDFENNLSIWRPQELRSAFNFFDSKAKSAKRIGMVFGILGAASTITGIVLISNSNQRDSFGYYFNDGNRDIGRGLIVAGLATGISVGMAGGINSGKYRRKADLVREELIMRKESLTKISIRPGYNPVNKNASLSLVLHF